MRPPVYISVLALGVMFAFVTGASMVLANPPPQPVFPAAFHGTLTVAGNPAAIGSIVCGRIDGVDKGCITITVTGQYGGPGAGDQKLIITAALGDVGKTISLFVTPPGTVGALADQTIVYTPGETLESNVSLPTMPATITPTQAPVVTEVPTTVAPTDVPTEVPTTVPTGGGGTGGGGTGGAGSGGGGGTGTSTSETDQAALDDLALRLET
jgi:hypothetical protein